MQNMENKVYLGVMSGSSLDGIDVCVCEFESDRNRVLDFQTFELQSGLRQKLKESSSLQAKELFELDVEYGQWLGVKLAPLVRQFEVVGIGLHGHTVFHEPAKGYSIQLGSGNHVAAKTGVPVVMNFRQIDIALGGQGAPLVSSVEKELYPQFDYFLNLGGIGNFSDHKKGLAWDVSPFNQVANYFASKEGLPFDEGGSLGASGRVNDNLLLELQSWHYYEKQLPKSLSNQQVQEYLSIFENYDCGIQDKLRTFYEQLLEVYSTTLPHDGPILVSGGGANNSYFIERLKEKGLCLDLPENQVIEGKEALVFAVLAKKRLVGEVNVNGVYTGSNIWSIAGDVSGYVKR